MSSNSFHCCQSSILGLGLPAILSNTSLLHSVSSCPPNCRVSIAKTTPNTVPFNLSVVEPIEGQEAADSELLVWSPDQQHPHHPELFGIQILRPAPRPTEPETLALAQSSGLQQALQGIVRLARVWEPPPWNTLLWKPLHQKVVQHNLAFVQSSGIHAPSSLATS